MRVMSELPIDYQYSVQTVIMHGKLVAVQVGLSINQADKLEFKMGFEQWQQFWAGMRKLITEVGGVRSMLALQKYRFFISSSIKVMVSKLAANVLMLKKIHSNDGKTKPGVYSVLDCIVLYNKLKWPEFRCIKPSSTDCYCEGASFGNGCKMSNRKSSKPKERLHLQNNLLADNPDATFVNRQEYAFQKFLKWQHDKEHFKPIKTTVRLRNIWYRTTILGNSSAQQEPLLKEILCANCMYCKQEKQSSSSSFDSSQSKDSALSVLYRNRKWPSVKRKIVSVLVNNEANACQNSSKLVGTFKDNIFTKSDLGNEVQPHVCSEADDTPTKIWNDTNDGYSYDIKLPKNVPIDHSLWRNIRCTHRNAAQLPNKEERANTDIALLQAACAEKPKPPNKLHLGYLDMKGILSALPSFRSYLLQVYEKAKEKSITAGYKGNNHLLVMDLIAHDKQMAMLQVLNDIFGTSNLNYKMTMPILANVVLPEWILCLFMQEFQLERRDAIKYLLNQEKAKTIALLESAPTFEQQTPQNMVLKNVQGRGANNDKF